MTETGSMPGGNAPRLLLQALQALEAYVASLIAQEASDAPAA